MPPRRFASAGRRRLCAGLVLLLFAFALVAPLHGAIAPPPAKPGGTRIMLLGDAIVQSDRKHASFRYWLYQQLHEMGYRVEFVGSQKDHQGGPPPKTDFDPRHEGHWGWTTGDAVREVDALAAAARPQIVVIHLGTHNVDPAAPAIADLEKLVDALRKASSRMTIVLTQIVPVLGSEEKTAAFNQALVPIAARKQSRTAPLLTIDLNGGFDPAKMRDADSPLPNEAGERFIADRLAGGLSVVLDHEVPIITRTLTGNLAPLTRFLRIGDYGGITAEIDELLAGRLQGAEASAAAELLDDIASYVAAQRGRVAYLVEQKRYCDAGPILERLARQFRGVSVGNEALAQLIMWKNDPKLAKELAAGTALAPAHQARLAQRYGTAYPLYLAVVKQHPGTQAAAEAQRYAADLEKRGLAR